MKTKVRIVGNYYGDIRMITNITGIVNSTTYQAAIYDAKTHEQVDNITFDSTEFPVHERSDVMMNSVFTFRVGYIGKKPFSNIRLKKREYPMIPPMTREESIALSQRLFNMSLEERLKENYDDFE